MDGNAKDKKDAKVNAETQRNAKDAKKVTQRRRGNRGTEERRDAKVAKKRQG